MKKLCLFLALTLLLLGGCGGASQDAAAPETMAMDMEMAVTEEAPAAEPMEAAPEGESGATDASGFVGGEISVELSEKIIYTAYAEIETTAFDESLETVSSLLAKYQGFIESSSITGNNLQDTYNGYSSYRNATYTLRIPRESFAAVTASLSEIGNVLYLSNDATNITTQYTDTASRLADYETEEARLLEILSKAETVEDMISVEGRLSEIRYEIENLTSQLSNWDNQVSYSTVTLLIWEVEILTPAPVQELTYWQEVGQSLTETLQWMFRTGKNLLKLLIAGLPILIPLAVIVTVPLVLVRRKRKKAHVLPGEEAPENSKE